MPFETILAALRWLLPGGGVALGAGGTLRLLFRSPRPRDLPPCNTRVLGQGSVLPWRKQVLIHCTKRGQFHIRVL